MTFPVSKKCSPYSCKVLSSSSVVISTASPIALRAVAVRTYGTLGIGIRLLAVEFRSSKALLQHFSPRKPMAISSGRDMLLATMEFKTNSNHESSSLTTSISIPKSIHGTRALLITLQQIVHAMTTDTIYTEKKFDVTPTP